MEYTGQNQRRQEERNTSSNPHVSAFILRPAFNGMESMRQLWE